MITAIRGIIIDMIIWIREYIFGWWFDWLDATEVKRRAREFRHVQIAVEDIIRARYSEAYIDGFRAAKKQYGIDD